MLGSAWVCTIRLLSFWLQGFEPRVLWIGIGGSIFFGVLEKTKSILAERNIRRWEDEWKVASWSFPLGHEAEVRLARFWSPSFPFYSAPFFFWTTNDFISAARSCEKSYRMYVYSSQCIQERAPMTMITVRAHRLKRCSSRIWDREGLSSQGIAVVLRFLLIL